MLILFKFKIRDLIDKAATDFCYINTKGNRKKLVKVILFYSITTALGINLSIFEIKDGIQRTKNTVGVASLLFSSYSNTQPML